MARTHNLGVAIDSMASNPSAHISALPSSSTAPSDLSGFDCNIGPSHSYQFYTKKQVHHGREPERGCDVASIQFPPSPPPTNSDPKRNVPLPSLSASADPGPSSPFSPPRTHFEGFRDPPALMKHVALGLHTPLTPPPTLPTPTLALPPADSVLSPIPKHDELELEGSLIGLPSSSRSRSPDEDNRTLLYPLSPEWIPTEMAYERSPPSPPSPPFTCDGNLLYGDHRYLGVSGMFDGHGLVHDNDIGSPDSQSQLQLQSRPILSLLDTSELSGFSPKSAWSESPTSSAVDMDMDMDMDIMDMDVDYDDELELDLLHTPTSLPASPFLRNKLDLDVDPEADDVMFGATAFHDPYQHPSAPSIHQISFPPPHPPLLPPPRTQPSAFLPSLDFDLELELADPTPSSPSSPSLRSFASLPSLSPCEDPEFHYDDEEAEDLPLLKLTSPPSPGPTLLALPGADTDDDLLPADLAPSPFPLSLPFGSTSSRPGFSFSFGFGFGSRASATANANADPTPTPHTPYSPLGAPSLLLVDDMAVGAPPRSPSPSPTSSSSALDESELDAADLEMVLMMAGYVDLNVRRLGEMRRRCVEAERAARAVEVALYEYGHGQGQGQVVQRRWEARRVRKREKERGREVGAMLRLKLGGKKKEKEKENAGGEENQNGDEHGHGPDVKLTLSDAEDESQRKRRRGSPSIQSMNQLVAKMLLRRNDTSRSLANRKTPFPLNGGKFLITSPLVRHVPLVGSDDDDDDDDGDDGEEDVDGSDARDSTPTPGREMMTGGGSEIAGLPPPFACVSVDALQPSAEMRTN